MKFEDIELPSNRKFGFFFAVVLAAIVAYLFDGKISFMELLLGSLCIMIFVLAIVFPSLLSPFNKAWMRFGYILGKIVSPIVLGVIFFFFITPIAFVMRISGRDELRLKMVGRKTHWKNRKPIGPDPSSFKDQF